MATRQFTNLGFDWRVSQPVKQGARVACAVNLLVFRMKGKDIEPLMGKDIVDLEVNGRSAMHLATSNGGTAVTDANGEIQFRVVVQNKPQIIPVRAAINWSGRKKWSSCTVIIGGTARKRTSTLNTDDGPKKKKDDSKLRLNNIAAEKSYNNRHRFILPIRVLGENSKLLDRKIKVVADTQIDFNSGNLEKLGVLELEFQSTEAGRQAFIFFKGKRCTITVTLIATGEQQKIILERITPIYQ